MNEFGPELGDQLTFIPAAFLNDSGISARGVFPRDVEVRVTGTVVQIHKNHRWYRVEFPYEGGIAHETFKF